MDDLENLPANNSSLNMHSRDMIEQSQANLMQMKRSLTEKQVGFADPVVQQRNEPLNGLVKSRKMGSALRLNSASDFSEEPQLTQLVGNAMSNDIVSSFDTVKPANRFSFRLARKR